MLAEIRVIEVICLQRWDWNIEEGLHQVTCVHRAEISGLAVGEQKEFCRIITIKVQPCALFLWDVFKRNLSKRTEVMRFISDAVLFAI